MGSYTGKDIRTLSPIEAIRERPGMYIGSADQNGIKHLLVEIVNNSVDEAQNGYGSKIEVVIDSKANTALVKDSGRGVPYDNTMDGNNALIELATNSHSGGKFAEGGEGAYKTSGGLHGIGLTAVNALSSSTTITSTRDGGAFTAKFSKGLLVSTDSHDGVDSSKLGSGTQVTFTPDKDIFKEHTFNYSLIKNYLEELSYLMSGITFVLIFDGNKEVFKQTNGIVEFVRKQPGDAISDVKHFIHKTDGYTVECAFKFNREGGERFISYVNLIDVALGGTHVTGAKTALTTIVNKLAKKYELTDVNDDNLKGDVIRKGLVMCINLKMEETPVFKSQTKEQLMSAGARTAMSVALNSNIDVFDKKLVKTIVDKALVEQKAEEAAKRARAATESILKGQKNTRRIGSLPDKLKDATGNGYRELFLVEGDSAGGTLSACKDNKTQALLPLRGKVLNTHDKELADIIENAEIKSMLMTFGCGVGDKVDIKKLRYDKIILATDADDDGAHIRLLILTMMIKHLRPIIEAGKVYTAVTPLFGIQKGKDMVYFYTQEELDNYTDKHGMPKHISRFKGLGSHSAEQIEHVLADHKTRKIIQLTTDDIEETVELYRLMMGKMAKYRKDIINGGFDDVE